MSKPLSFQEAIAQSTEWIRLWDQDELSDDVLADKVGALVRERDGARGFFVASLTSDSPLMDRLPEPLIYQLRLAGEGVVDLTVRNLAMSTAMGVHHKRNHDQSLSDGSMRVRSRCLDLLRVLNPHQVKNRLESLANGINSVGEDKEFLQRWGYDDEQLGEIWLTISKIAV
ncbi:MAG: hypothetical protein ACO3ZD_08795 [Cyanobium sp.]